jgi:hypothetical protein
MRFGKISLKEFADMCRERRYSEVATHYGMSRPMVSRWAQRARDAGLDVPDGRWRGRSQGGEKLGRHVLPTNECARCGLRGAHECVKLKAAGLGRQWWV